MVGGDGVAQLGEAPGAADAPDLGLLEDVVEERRVADVGGVLVPGEQRGVLAGDGVPPGGSLEDVPVLGLERGAGDVLLGELGDLGVGGPDVPQEHLPPVVGDREGLPVQVDVHASGDGVRDNEGRGGKVVGLHQRVDPTLEVPVGGCDGGDHQVVGLYGVGDLVGQGSGVPDACHAAVSADLESQLLQVHQQTGVLQVLGDDLGSRGQGGLDVVLRLQAQGGGLLGDQSGGDHHGGVCGVGA